MRTPTLRTLTLALAAGAASVILIPAGAANAISPCMSDPPPDWCFDPPPTVAPTPAAPTNLTLPSQLQTSVTLQFTDNSTNETDWRIQRDAVVGNTSTTTYVWKSSTTTSTTGTVSVVDDTAPANAYVTYRVTAVDANPAYDSESYSTTLGPMNGRTKPQPANPVVTALSVSYNQTYHLLSVRGAAADWDTTGAIQVQLTNDDGQSALPTASAYYSGFNAQNPGYGDYHGFSWSATVTTKGTHTICAQPLNYGGGANPAPSCGAYTVFGPPSAATNVTVTVGATSVTVKFKDNANDETSWYVQRSTDGQVSWYQVGSAYAPITGAGGTGSAVVNDTPAPGTCYRILMTNSYGATPSAAACTP